MTGTQTVNVVVASIMVNSGKYLGSGGFILYAEAETRLPAPRTFDVLLDYDEPPTMTIENRPATRAEVIDWMSKAEEPQAAVTQDWDKYGKVVDVNFWS